MSKTRQVRPAGYDEALQTVRVYYGTDGNGSVVDTAQHFGISWTAVSLIVNTEAPELGTVNIRKILRVKAADIVKLRQQITATVVANNQSIPAPIGYKERKQDRFSHYRKRVSRDEFKPL